MGKKKRIDVLIGARVKPEIVQELDELIADHELLNTGVIWTRSDLIRQALIVGLERIRGDLDVAHGRVSPRKAG